MKNLNKGENRTESFRRNKLLEELLEELNNNLWTAEQQLLNKDEKELPMIFIVGPLRSGSTLMMQWLANTKQFSYPTNLLSRFLKAPIIGAKIQLLLTDEKYNFRNELEDLHSSIEYSSENGKTKGVLSPNEFWYFWRRFLNFDELDYLPNEVLLENVDIDTLKSELIGVANVFQKPLALKAMICNYNIEFLNKVFDKAIFIYTKRNPYTNIESALKARERQLGSTNQWYSFKIPEYNELIKINDPIIQTAGQIYSINRAVQKGLDSVEEHKKIIVNYEEFCENPKEFYVQLYDKLKIQGFEINKDYSGPESFNITRKEINNSKIIEAYNEFVANKSQEI